MGALVIVVVAFCSGYQLAGYLEADKADRAAAALRRAREAYAASRADASAAREFSARLLTEAVAARSERETAEAQRGIVDITVTAVWRPASDGQQRRPLTALGCSQEQQFEQPGQAAAWSEVPDPGTVFDAAIDPAGAAVARLEAVSRREFKGAEAPDPAIHARHLTYRAEPEAGR